jgi:uncharacterized membrane protein YfcA
MQIYLPIAELPVDVLFVLAASLAVGFVSGMFGIGGGFLMTPILIFIGVPPAVAVASEAPQIAASAFTGALAYWRKRQIDLRLGGALVVGGLAGSGLGVSFFNAMRAAGQLDAVIAVSYVALLGAIGGLMLVESVRTLVRSRPSGEIMPSAVPAERRPIDFSFRRPAIFRSVASLLSLIALGGFVGFAGAVLGVGGGFLLVPALVYLFRVPTAVVVGTSQFQIVVAMLASTMMHAVTSGSVDIVLATLLIIGGSIGSQFGVRIGQKLRGEQLRLALALLLIAVGARFLVDLATPPVERFSAAVAETRP